MLPNGLPHLLAELVAWQLPLPQAWGFQATVASIYQSQNKLDAAQEILERSINAQIAANQKPSTAVLLQLAGIYLMRNDAAKAFPIYRQILTDNPDRTDAWKGLLLQAAVKGDENIFMQEIGK